MRPPPAVIDTARLRLRRAELADAETVFRRWAADPEVTRYLTFRPHQAVGPVVEYLRRCEAAWREATGYAWLIVARADHRALGMIDLRPHGHHADLGYVLARDAWGQGVATEALRAVLAWGLAQPDLYRLWAVCDVDNPASARVMEKAGMQREGRLHRWILHPNVSEEPRDCWCYALTK